MSLSNGEHRVQADRPFQVAVQLHFGEGSIKVALSVFRLLTHYVLPPV